MAKEKTKWQKLMEPRMEPRRVWINYVVTVPAAHNRAIASGYSVSGWEGEAEQEAERLVRAFRAVGEEPTVTRSRNEPIEM